MLVKLIMTSDDPTRQRIRQLRDAAGLSQTKLAWRTGIHRSTLAQIELGYIKLYPGHLKRIARALGVTMDELRGVEAA